MFLNTSEVGILTLIVAVMLPEALVLCVGAAFERIAGSPFLNTATVSFLKNQLYICLSCGVWFHN